MSWVFLPLSVSGTTTRPPVPLSVSMGNFFPICLFRQRRRSQAMSSERCKEGRGMSIGNAGSGKHETVLSSQWVVDSSLYLC